MLIILSPQVKKFNEPKLKLVENLYIYIFFAEPYLFLEKYGIYLPGVGKYCKVFCEHCIYDGYAVIIKCYFVQLSFFIGSIQHAEPVWSSIQSRGIWKSRFTSLFRSKALFSIGK